MLGLVLGPVLAAPVLVVAALASPEWAGRKTWPDAGVIDKGPVSAGVAGVWLFSILVGTSSALGFLETNSLVLAGSLVLAFYARCLGGESLGPGRAALAFTPLAASVLAPALRFGTLDLAAIFAAQGALGPSVLTGPPASAILAATSVMAGMAGGFGWVAAPPRPRSARLDALMKWGESALVATTVTAGTFGTPLGAALRGPFGDLWLQALLSFVTALGAAALLSSMRRTSLRLGRGRAIGLAAVAIAAAVGGAFLA